MAQFEKRRCPLPPLPLNLNGNTRPRVRRKSLSCLWLSFLQAIHFPAVSTCFLFPVSPAANHWRIQELKLEGRTPVPSPPPFLPLFPSLPLSLPTFSHLGWERGRRWAKEGIPSPSPSSSSPFSSTLFCSPIPSPLSSARRSRGVVSSRSPSRSGEEPRPLSHF